MTTAPASRRPWLLAVVPALPELTGFAFFVVRAGLILFDNLLIIQNIYINTYNYDITLEQITHIKRLHHKSD